MLIPKRWAPTNNLGLIRFLMIWHISHLSSGGRLAENTGKTTFGKRNKYNLPQCYLVHHKSYTVCPGTEPARECLASWAAIRIWLWYWNQAVLWYVIFCSNFILYFLFCEIRQAYGRRVEYNINVVAVRSSEVGDPRTQYNVDFRSFSWNGQSNTPNIMVKFDGCNIWAIVGMNNLLWT